jgi:hypothetical protein
MRTYHGLSRHPLYSTWNNMLSRCEKPGHPDYKDYGGRGITVCPRWHDVISFTDDIERILGPKPSRKMSLDRIRNGIGYKPSNVRWATAEQQSNNQRNNQRKNKAKINPRSPGAVTYAADLINTQVRLPRELRDRLRVRADADRLSVNATIIVLLEQALAGELEEAAS